MLISSVDAAAICGVSRSYFIRLAKSLGMKPDRQGSKGVTPSEWGARHVLGLVVIPTLEKLGVAEDSAVAVCQRIACGFHSDEALEAVISDGRHWLMVVARTAPPELFFLDAITAAEKELSTGLARMGARVEKVSVAVLFEQICTAARNRAGVQPAE